MSDSEHMIEKQKIIKETYNDGKIDGRMKAIDDCIDMIINNFDMQKLYLPIDILEKLQSLKEQRK